MYKSLKRLLSVALLCATALLLVLILVSPSYSGLGLALPAQDLTPWAHLPLVVREPTPENPPAIEITYIHRPDVLPAAYEYVEIKNMGGSAQSMQGWTLNDQGRENVYSFPDGFTLQPGASVKVHTAAGNDTATDLYWGKGTRIWDKDGDTAYLYNQSGDLVDTYAYPTSGPTATPSNGETPAIDIIYIHRPDILPAAYEYIEIKNNDSSAQDMRDWKLNDHGEENVYFFPDGFTLQPGASVKVHTAAGNDTATDLYWGKGTRIWDKDGDTAYLYNQSGDLVDTYTY